MIKGFRLKDVAIPNEWAFTSYQKTYINFKIRNYLLISTIAITNILLLTFSPLKQTKQPGLHIADAHNLLNLIKNKDCTNTGSELRSPLKKTTNSSYSMILQL